MNNKTTVKAISASVTIYNTILIIILAVLAMVCLYYGNEVAAYIAGEGDLISKYDGSGVADGYMLLGGLFLGSLGILGEIILYVMAAVFGAVALYYIFPVVWGIVILIKSGKYAETDESKYYKNFKIEGIIKAIFNGIPSVVLWLLIFTDLRDAGVIIIGIGAINTIVTGLSVYQITLCSENSKSTYLQ